jgi:hypothetical protein
VIGRASGVRFADEVGTMRARVLKTVLPAAAGIVIVMWSHPRGIAADSPQSWTLESRRDALARAVVWQPPSTPLRDADLSQPAHGLPDEVSCAFRVAPMDGTVRKFSCTLPSGETLRVKYAGPEPHGEAAASRLLLALGFGADRVGFVRRLHCAGCPWAPFATMKAVTLARAVGLYERVVRYDRKVTFDWVAVERRDAGEQIETDDVEGWTFEELSRVSTASRTHADALRLMAVFLAHWDNKAENQRLVCLSGGPDAHGRCAKPFAMLQDVGATFGPRKVDLEAWRKAPIWTDRARCEVSMATLPHGGATFVPARISEAGRKFLADALQSLSREQVVGLFTGARVEPKYGRVQQWADVFEARVAQLADGPACPS